MKNGKKFSIMALLTALICLNTFAQTAVEIAMDNINKNLVLNEYEKAYSGALFIMKFYNNSAEEISIEYEVAVEKAVSSYFTSLDSSSNWNTIVQLKKDIPYYPQTIKEITKSYFTKADSEIEIIKQNEIINQQKLEKEQQAAKEEADKAKELAYREEESKRQQKQLESIISITQHDKSKEIEQQQRFEELQQKSQESFNSALKQISESNTQNMQSITTGNKTFIYVFTLLAFVVFISLVLLVVIIIRHQHLQEMQFQTTMQTMRAMRTITPTYDSLTLPFQQASLALPDKDNHQSSSQQLFLSQDTNISPQQQLTNLISTCEHYGIEIDKVTGRKNASRLVADLIYQISRQLGYSEEDSIVYFAVGLVYDIGFLNIDTAILRADYLSKEQFEILKTHTQIGLNMVFFVNEQWRELFREGVSKHHENLDGTGYPNALKEDNIPYIARVIHVAESYVALISRRDYKEIKDRNSAVMELREQTDKYDKSIVDALDEIV